MTLIENGTIHVGELKLRRFRTGELSGQVYEDVARHTTDCGFCRTKLRLLQEEQRQFEHEIPFDRFAGGVERACRVPRLRPRRLWALSSAFGLAAAAAVMLLVWPFGTTSEGVDRRLSRIKGASSALVRIATASGGGQRSLLPDQTATLQPGERIRLGYHTTTSGFLIAVSVDDKGDVTLLYPETGGALSIAPTQHTSWLPDSLELTGAGSERIFLFLADQPLNGEAVKKSVRSAHLQAQGDLSALPTPIFDGRTEIRLFTWLLQKP